MAELTREQVLAMEAGPELDALIERHLFRRTGGVDWAALGWTAKRYSTHIALAWEVLKSVGGRGERAWGLFFAELFCTATRRLGRPIHYTDMLFLLTPEDICKAALLTTLTESDPASL